MKTYALVLLCALACSSCARQMTTLSDGQPGYVVYCEVTREFCMDEIIRLCRNKSYMLVSERAREVRPEGFWDRRFNNQYWMEARCDVF
jgi:hypothetical protein